MQNRLLNIQALRGFAVLCVVFVHLATIETKYGGIQTILPHFLEFGMIGVDLFFVISGFIMLVTTRGKFQNISSASRFLYHRFFRIYPTYWVYTTIVLVIYIIHPSIVNSTQGNQVDILASYLLYPSYVLPLVMVGWTLIHEVYFYILFALILFFVSEKYLLLAVTLWGILITLLNLNIDSQNPLFNLVTHPLTLEFIAGVFIGRFYFTFQNNFSLGFVLLVLLLGIGATYYLYDIQTLTFDMIIQNGWLRILFLGLPSVTFVVFMLYLEQKSIVMPPFLILLGDTSYSIYLSHILTLNAIGHIWQKVNHDSIYDNLIALPMILIATIIVGFLSYTWIEKPLFRLRDTYEAKIK